MYVYVCMYMYACICMYVYVCMYMYVCICMYVYVCVYVCVYMYVCMYVFMCMCVYAYMCMYVCITYWGGELSGGKCPTQNGRGNCPGRNCPGELSGGIVQGGNCPTPVPSLLSVADVQLWFLHFVGGVEYSWESRGARGTCPGFWEYLTKSD